MAGPGTEAKVGKYYGRERTRIQRGAGGLGTAGPSFRGPAFVPISVESLDGFIAKFGNISAESFATMAVASWLENGSGCAFVRLLGVGDGEKRITVAGLNAAGEDLPVGAVKNSGFIVGSRSTGSNGYLGSNPFAIDGGLSGRTYFLGAFMSESAGSTYLSDAGIQEVGIAASTAQITPVTTTKSDYIGGKLTVVDSKTGNSVTYLLCVEDNGGVLSGNPATGDDASTYGGTAGECCIQFGSLGTITVSAASAIFKDGINSVRGNNLGVADSNIKVTNNVTHIILEQLSSGHYGNVPLTRRDVTSDSVYTVSGFSGGKGAAVPILRGVLFAASGVLPALSGNYTQNTSTASLGPTKGTFTIGNDGGASIGSVNMTSANQSFKLLLNGHISTTEYPNEILASFNPVATDAILGTSIYIPNVLNTDPTKIREAGHYLYTHYDIYESQAQASSFSIVNPTKEWTTLTGDKLIDCAFLVTSSIPRNATDSSGVLTIPNFENFSDRYQTAKSPTVISQYLNRKQHDLFKFHALDDGTIGSDQLKITISGITPPEKEDDYGTFDVTVRSITDVDSYSLNAVSGSESFVGCNLNPSSDNYVAKMIGDEYYYYNFDAKRADGKRLTLSGEHGNASTLIRVEVSDAVKNQTLPTKILPAGFRGFGHLVTSGSSIMINPQHPLGGTSAGSVVTASTGWGHKIIEPPIPYRIRNSDEKGSGLPTGARTLDSNLTWGVDTTIFHTIKRPNQNLAFNDSIKSYTKYFPSFTTVRQKAFVSDNVGTADSDGTVYDVDKFNNNKFSIENLLVHVSADDNLRTDQWAYSKYSRGRKKEPLMDSSLIEKSGDLIRFFNFEKDLTPASTTTVTPFIRFTFLLQGGFDGVNMFSAQAQQFSNLAAYYEMLDSAQGNKEGQVTAAYITALKMLEDKSEVDITLLALPGIRIEAITNQAIETSESRFDTFYIMDVEEVDSEGALLLTGSFPDVAVGPNPALTASRFRSRALNSSFVGAYFPDIQMLKPQSPIGTLVYVPPSVSALRVYGRMFADGSVQAPAGYIRGKIASEGTTGQAIQTKINMSGINETETVETLYKVAINPIIGTDDGLVLFGQRTLLTTANSMLQRISVRRMIIDIRRYCRSAARAILFDQNREDVLKNFRELINPIMSSMLSRGGISRYKVVVDETTTTQADIENNTVRGKVFLQPNKSDEIIQVDFVT